MSGVLMHTKVWENITSWAVWCFNAHKSLRKHYELAVWCFNAHKSLGKHYELGCLVF